MVKYKVEWSVEARLDLLDVLDFYNQRNGNARYSRKLYLKINKSINLIARNPSLGLRTNIESVRALVNGDYHVIYEIYNRSILVIMLWDCNRNPHDKNISFRRR